MKNNYFQHSHQKFNRKKKLPRVISLGHVVFSSNKMRGRGGIGCTKLGARHRAKYIIYDTLIVEWNEKVY